MSGKPRRCGKELQTERGSDGLWFHGMAVFPLILSLHTAWEEQSPQRSAALKHSHTFREIGLAALVYRCWPINTLISSASRYLAQPAQATQNISLGQAAFLTKRAFQPDFSLNSAWL